MNIWEGFRLYKSALIDGPYRYRLSRGMAPVTGSVTFVMLNPSTADATEDDPTIRRCLGYADYWNYRQMMVVNLFAYRATEPKALRAAMLAGVNVEGKANDSVLLECAERSAEVVLAWGATEWARPQAVKVVTLLNARLQPEQIVCLGLTKDGSPRHPLYAKGEIPAEVFPVSEFLYRMRGGV